STLAAATPETPPAASLPQEQVQSPPPPVAPEPARAVPAASAEVRGNGRVFASPLARRMAQQAGLDLAAIRGSGPNGRVVKADIDRVLAVPGAAAPPARAPAVAPAATPAAAAAPGMPVFAKAQVLALAGNPPHTEKPHSAMRRVIARRLAESKQTVPHFYLS